LKSECLARADGCLKLKDYPYTQAELDKCEWLRYHYKSPAKKPDIDNESKAMVIGLPDLAVTLVNVRDEYKLTPEE